MFCWCVTTVPKLSFRARYYYYTDVLNVVKAETFSAALHQPTQRLVAVPQSVANSLTNEIWGNAQAGTVSGNPNAIRDASKLEEYSRHQSLAERRAIAAARTARVSGHDLVMMR